eukprot:TRINITY_DN1792_c0_g1_i6.p1 TRINITY_DN1792_c0_g1~~TRINITY_DN1792_c0_g1_i6.p1  ORF type:complete len:107 (+),score=10.37 TRINITY_DN1792_c0_g1_i6:774-1094(+)
MMLLTPCVVGITWPREECITRHLLPDGSPMLTTRQVNRAQLAACSLHAWPSVTACTGSSASLAMQHVAYVFSCSQPKAVTIETLSGGKDRPWQFNAHESPIQPTAT